LLAEGFGAAVSGSWPGVCSFCGIDAFGSRGTPEAMP
jgi:hypothetical protein